MTISESPKDVKHILNLIREIRPDQAENFAKAEKWFMEVFPKQFGTIEVDEIKCIIERSLAFHQGPITISTVFNWVKEGLARNTLMRMRENKVPQQGYYK